MREILGYTFFDILSIQKMGELQRLNRGRRVRFN